MIKANELRIGNAIMVTATQSMNAHVSFIVELNKNKVRVSRDDDNGMGCDFEDIKPIPLTPEILEKCGFETHRWGGHYNDVWILNNVEIPDSGKVSSFKYSYHYYTDSDEKKYFKGINNLHQLQNLYFALTGEELNIQL